MADRFGLSADDALNLATPLAAVSTSRPHALVLIMRLELPVVTLVDTVARRRGTGARPGVFVGVLGNLGRSGDHGPDFFIAEHPDGALSRKGTAAGDGTRGRLLDFDIL